ncbi:MAG TPA: hypothetical protein DIW20_03620 [Rhodospirillaceae bacterium]|nr:hypothetical protein [Rhodospirillaceae bacterium]
MLTPKQRQLLDFIGAYNRRTGCGPSYDEMTAALGLASKAGIHRLINALEERGHIERLPKRARAIQLKQPPAPLSGDETVQLLVDALRIAIIEMEDAGWNSAAEPLARQDALRRVRAAYKEAQRATQQQMAGAA